MQPARQAASQPASQQQTASSQPLADSHPSIEASRSRGRRQRRQPVNSPHPFRGAGRDANLVPMFSRSLQTSKELRGDPPRPPTLSKKRPKIQRKITSNKNSPLFSKLEPNGSPLGPEILPKSIKSQTKALEALITKSSEKLLEKVSLQTPPGPLKSSKIMVGCVKNRRSLYQVFLGLRCPS